MELSEPREPVSTLYGKRSNGDEDGLATYQWSRLKKSGANNFQWSRLKRAGLEGEESRPQQAKDNYQWDRLKKSPLYERYGL